MNILIVDDSRSARTHISNVLVRYGNCDFAVNGAEAVERFSAALESGTPYDLIIMDIVMPEMDGFAAAEKINRIQEEKNIDAAQLSKMIMLSGQDDPEHMLKAHFETGVEHYITKPFEEKTLVEALTNLGLIEAPIDLEEPLCKT